MSDTTLDDGTDPAQHNREGFENRQKDRADKAESRAEAAERELALVRAGIDTSTPAGKFFADNYDGELDPDAVKARAAEVNPGLLEASTPEPTSQTPPPPGDEPNPDEPTPPNIPDSEVEGIEGGRDLANGSPPDQLSDPDPYGVAVGITEKAIEEGMQEGQAKGLAFASVVHAAMEGDERVILPGSGRVE